MVFIFFFDKSEFCTKRKKPTEGGLLSSQLVALFHQHLVCLGLISALDLNEIQALCVFKFNGLVS